MKDQLITLFGGGGFVGRYVAQALLAAGARVRVAQRVPRDAWFLKPLGGLGQTQFVAADVTRPATVARAIEGADAVVNLVGSFADMAAVNAGGARIIAETAAAKHVGALVHVSALGADPESPSTYGRTKGEGEKAVLVAFPGATILRPSLVFGREDQFTNRFAGLIARAPVLPVLRGQARFQPVYVKDVATAAARALAGPEHHAGRIYELGGPDVLTMTELYRWLGRAIGREPLMVDLPDSLGSLIAAFGFLPGAPITMDQWRMLHRDNVVSSGAEGLGAFGIDPTPLASVAPAWLVRFRRHGRFAKRLPA
ncbi:complex I NDUFA9 subunit family protein [Sphingomonas sp. DT-204]|uniref:complex I NDUFA9 subunit family protein n=1 Tax=Sphingomonas sp. DT-204 TaxID=3396166 RepID=UPI003F1DF7CB